MITYLCLALLFVVALIIVGTYLIFRMPKPDEDVS